MKLAITGASGLIGTQLTEFLSTGGHHVQPLVRRRSQAAADDAVFWNPETGEVETDLLEGIDAVVHLAGESITDPWTRETKARILHSRVRGTRTLSRALAKMSIPPRVLVCASGVDYYGNRGDEILDETSEPGETFLANVCLAWEDAADAAREAGIRVVHTRFGMALSADGGALARMLLPFRLGLGGRLGSGKQYWSWIALDDLVAAILHCIRDDQIRGPVNVVAPEILTNAQFTRTLGSVLHRPTILPMPATAVRFLFGQMGDEVLLGSKRVLPARLVDSGFEFAWPHLLDALTHELGAGEAIPEVRHTSREPAGPQRPSTSRSVLRKTS